MKLISLGAVIKHKGIMADNSTKIEIFLNELSTEEAGILSELCKKKVVNLIFSNDDMTQATPAIED